MTRLGWILASCGTLFCAACEKTDENTFITTTAQAPPSEPAHSMGKASCSDCHSWNIVKMHDSASPEYNSDCILCHGDMSDEAALSSSVPGIHPRMCPYVYQAAGQTEMNNAVCVFCHKSVDFLEGSAGNLRKQVAVSKCVTCHTVAGPGRALYQQ